MPRIEPAPDAAAARWLLEAPVEWTDLVRYGPPGFAAYVRVALAGAPEREDGEAPTLRMALAHLAQHTATPERAFAAVWEGWTSTPARPEAPQVPIPYRTMLLFTGPVASLRDAPALAWHGTAEGEHQEPHLAWPEDHAWCVACEVDEEIEFTVGCSVAAAESLAEALPGAVRRVEYAAPAPMYRDLEA